MEFAEKMIPTNEKEIEETPAEKAIREANEKTLKGFEYRKNKQMFHEKLYKVFWVSVAFVAITTFAVCLFYLIVEHYKVK